MLMDINLILSGDVGQVLTFPKKLERGWDNIMLVRDLISKI